LSPGWPFATLSDQFNAPCLHAEGLAASAPKNAEEQDDDHQPARPLQHSRHSGLSNTVCGPQYRDPDGGRGHKQREYQQQVVKHC